MKTYNIFTDEEDSIPTGKADFLLLGNELKSYENEKVTQALFVEAISNLDAFSSVGVLDVAEEENSSQNTKEIIAKGMSVGTSYELMGSYLILGEDTKKRSMSKTQLLFYVGFLLEASRRFHVVLAGATQMANCLLLADELREKVLMRVKSDNITFATTAWAAKDKNSKIQEILGQLSYIPHAIYTTFSLENAEVEVLKKYDEGTIEEGIGAGASLAYATANNRSNQELLDAIELIIYMK